MAKKTTKLSSGSVYLKTKNGNYYFRYQIKGKRKSVSLGTKNKEEAILKADELADVVTAPSKEVIAAHVQFAKGWKEKQSCLELNRIWDLYSKHPDRVRPKSMKIWKIYEAYLNEFLTWLKSNFPSTTAPRDLCLYFPA